MEASFALKGQEAKLVSAAYTRSADSCKLNMYAYMYGAHIGQYLPVGNYT